jgi:hypothetical protein
MSDVPDVEVIEALRQPELATSLANKLTKPSIPLMGALPADTVTLPGGYLDQDGLLHTDARIREINGSDEEAMARELRNPTVNVPKVVDLLLRRCVLSVGTMDPVPPAILADLLSGDRAYLMLKIRMLTFGADWEVPDFPCRFCGQTFGTIIDLDSIKVKKLENPMVQDVEVSLRNGHLAMVHLLSGAVQLEMVGDGNRTGPEEITIAINRSLRSIDGQPVTTPMAQKMSMADRRSVTKAMADGQPGPVMEEVEVACLECGREGDYTVSLVDLFR